MPRLRLHELLKDVVLHQKFSAKTHPEHCSRDRVAPPHSHPALQALHSGNLDRNITIQAGVKVTVTKVNHEVQAMPRCTAPTCGAGTMAEPPLL